VLTEPARRLSSGIVGPIALAIGRTGVSPNALTLGGTLLHVGVAWLLAAGHLRAGAVALAIAAAFDGLDGALARRTGCESVFGAFLDSTFDRVSEILVFLGLLVYSQRTDLPVEGRLVLVALAGSLMVSYTRARSEGLRCGTKVGVFGRLERMLVLVVGLLLGWLTAALWILAVGAWLTAAHRVIDVRRRCREAEGRPEAGPGRSTAAGAGDGMDG
jgi:CDP-diacylglycerol--glycerol-3-phosphate 3-phosphatidyltransferase